MTTYIILVLLTLNWPSQEPSAATYRLTERFTDYEECIKETLYMEWRLNSAASKLRGLHFDVLCKEK